jgi:hypothetical protein
VGIYILYLFLHRGFVRFVRFVPLSVNGHELGYDMYMTFVSSLTSPDSEDQLFVNDLKKLLAALSFNGRH